VGELVRVEVEDNGIGMTEEIRRHLFDPFYTTKGQSGTGLGMSVAYGIITRHDGAVEVETALGSGTRFLLSFPLSDPGRRDDVEEAVIAPPDARPGRILVIDDEQPIAQLLEDVLRDEGHFVEVAVSGEEGLRLAAAGRYDLVLTDLGMPDMSGWEVASRIRARLPGVPVVLVTGWGTTLTQNEIDRSGVAAVVHKPFEIREVVETTHRVLEQAALLRRS
jgi:CheY-like chemotaxis protein